MRSTEEVDPASGIGGDTTAAVSDEFTVIPAGAVCTAVPADATVTPATGATRTVGVEVDADASVTVTVRCANGVESDAAAATFAAGEGCSSALGVLGGEQAQPVAGTISADADCVSTRRRHPHSIGNRTYCARWHTFALDSPGWVTITLESAATNSRHLDPFVILLSGGAGDGTGTHIDHNDDHRSGYDTHRWNSRLVEVFLQRGSYTIEATTYGQRRTGDYTLTVDAARPGWPPHMTQPWAANCESSSTSASSMPPPPHRTATSKSAPKARAPAARCCSDRRVPGPRQPPR
ncbi:hypothetical protein [Candidatus Poriferisodalis sp.]|uniref:hypothetical protein n=1 Tax=Candidatus Poriferisodalis sp. TaxID=3101277 RepID=UPI003B01E192